MNKQFEQWAVEYFSPIGMEVVDQVYNHLQSNPHLLREDGERISFKDSEPPLGSYICHCFEDGSEIEGVYTGIDYTYTDSIPTHWYYVNPRPEPKEDLAAYNTPISGQNWTELAEGIIKKHNGDFTIDPSELKKAITALTEGMQEAYERGREEAMDYAASKHKKYVEELQQQMAECLGWYKMWEVKKAELAAAKEQLAEKDEEVIKWHGGYISLYKELTAAKAEITRLEQLNCDLELALKNL